MYTSSQKPKDRNKQTVSNSATNYQSDSGESATPQIIWNLGEKMLSENCWSYKHKALLNVYKTFKMLKGKSLVEEIQTCAMNTGVNHFLCKIKWRKSEHLKSFKSFVFVYLHFMMLSNVCQQQIPLLTILSLLRRLKIDSTRNTAVRQHFIVFTPFHCVCSYLLFFKIRKTGCWNTLNTETWHG